MKQTLFHQKDYYFLTDKVFDDYIKNDAFLEWCHVHQHRYGTLHEPIIKNLMASYDVIVEIDVEGDLISKPYVEITLKLLEKIPSQSVGRTKVIFDVSHHRVPFPHSHTQFGAKIRVTECQMRDNYATFVTFVTEFGAEIRVDFRVDFVVYQCVMKIFPRVQYIV